MHRPVAFLKSAALYLALALFANTAAAQDIADLREGDMRKLVVHDAPKPLPAIPFETFEGAETSLAAYEGQIVVLNFWATWCAPCRHEMPTLSALQEALGGADAAVVTIATGRNPPQGMRAFFNEIGVENLPLYRDPRQALARNFGVLGLPVTLILDREGNEVARLQGDADWASDSAKAIIAALVAGES